MKTLLLVGKTYTCPECKSKYLTQKTDGGFYTKPLDERKGCGFWCDASFKAWGKAS